MTNLRETVETYKNGSKGMAYLLFKDDPNSNKGVSFESFCKGMDKMIGSVQSVCSATGKVERC